MQLLLLNDIIQDAPGRRIGWMHGFVWTKNQVYDIKSYQELWLAQTRSILPQILNDLQKTRKFIQHRCIEVFDLINYLVRIVLTAAIAIQITLSQLKQEELENTINYAIIQVLLFGTTFLAAKISRIRLKRKIVNYLKDLSYKYRDQKIQIRFQLHIKKLCLCIPLCSCFQNWDYGVIQIWLYNQQQMYLPQAQNQDNSQNRQIQTYD